MRLTLRQIRGFIIGLIFLVLAGGVGYRLGQSKPIFPFLNSLSKLNISSETKIDRKTPADKQGLDFNLFWQVWDRVEQTYLDRKEIDRKEMVYGAIKGMVDSLDDPYTFFLPPTENKEAKEDLRGDFEGVGIQIGYKEQKLSVMAPLSGTPAEKSGLKAGDLILRIVDEGKKIDKNTDGITLPEAVNLIRGPRGSLVKLTVARKGIEKPFEVSLKRETIVVKSVEVKFSYSAKSDLASKNKEEKAVAVLKLSRFGERTYEEWEEAIDKIKNESIKNKNFSGVVLDLRNNPGGFLQGAVFVGSEFLSSGPVVLQDKGVNGKETFSINRKGRLLREPLVVLINGGSASASEIVAGALQEIKRAKLVGEKSFGKGTVQEAQDLEGGAGLHVTVARWLLPSGKSIDKEGVKPDFEVKMDEKDLPAGQVGETKDLQLEKAIELLTQ